MRSVAGRVLPVDWRLGHSDQPWVEPDRWVDACVPGTVQSDWAAAEGWPESWIGEEFRRYRWMEDVYWTYQALLPDFPLAPGDELWVECDGADYAGSVRLGGYEVGGFEGPYSGFAFDLSEAYRRGERDLRVSLVPPPSLPEDGTDRRITTQSTKASVFYGWDFAPRLVPLGLFAETRLVVRRAGRPLDVRASYRLSEDLARAEVAVCVSFGKPFTGTLRWTMRDADGAAVVETEESVGGWEVVKLTGIVGNPALWWPNGMGEAHLYRCRLEIVASDGETVDCWEWQEGLRSVRLGMYEGQWDEPSDFPKSRVEPPITLWVNGKAVFAKGSNWVPPDQLHGTTTSERYRDLVGLAKSAHFNLLRVWGGGGVPHRAFFDACDEAGLLVWQEFPLACGRYEGTDLYLKQLEMEARAVVRKLRGHACVALWCGGNELFNNWSGMTDQDLALRLLNRVCYEEDRERPFLPTSPIEGMAHGNYTFVDLGTGREVYEVFAGARATAYTEFGSSGPASEALIRSVVPADELWPPREGTNWEWHNGLRAWDGTEHSWLMLPTIERYFGAPSDLSDLIERGQHLQSEGLRFIYEEARRQAPRCSMALCWAFNEPWPTVANNSIVSWPAQPKPAYEAVRQACRPTCLTLRVRNFEWRVGETFEAEVWLLNDGPPLDCGFRVLADGIEVAVGTVSSAGFRIPGRGPTVRFEVPDGVGPVFDVEVSDPEGCFHSIYRLFCVN